MLSDKNAAQVEKNIIKHVVKINEVIEEMHKMLLDYMQEHKEFKQESYQVHRLEQEADQIRSEIVEYLFKGAFLAVYRTDYFDIVDRLDRIANHAELFSDFMFLTRPTLPDYMIESINKIISVNREISVGLLDFINVFIRGEDTFFEKKEVLNKLEARIDKIQFNVTRQIFKSDIEKIEKFHLKSVIDKLSRLSDLVEDVADRIEVMAAKLRM